MRGTVTPQTIFFLQNVIDKFDCRPGVEHKSQRYPFVYTASLKLQDSRCYGANLSICRFCAELKADSRHITGTTVL